VEDDVSDTRQPGPSDDDLAVAAWLDRLGALLPAGTLDEVGPAERAALLDLARIAAHQSHRRAAPISTYLAGLAFASLPRAERLERITELAAQLEGDGNN
jgi:hypothetical protein